MRGLALSLALIGFAGAGCGASRPTGMPAANASPAPTAEQVRNATIVGVFDRSVTLRDGLYEGPPFVEGGAARPRLLLIQNLVAFGNLDGAVGNEAAALLAESSGGSGERIYLSVIDARDGQATSLATVAVGDRTKIRSFLISGAAIVLDVVQAGPTDPACCPTQLARKTYVMDRGSLKLHSSTVTGTLSVASLAGAPWTAVEIDGLPLPAGAPRPAAAFAGDRVAGFSGCNRYTATIRETAAGEIAIGSVAGTTMACPEPETQIEARFLGSLGKVTRYTFLAGRLLLWGTEGGAIRSILLTRE